MHKWPAGFDRYTFKKEVFQCIPIKTARTFGVRISRPCKVVKCWCHYISMMNHQMELQFEDVIKVLKSDDKTFIKWISEQNIIPNIHQVHFCHSCKSLMKINYSPKYVDGAVFKCMNSKCRNTMSIRLNTWTSQSKLSLRGFVHILACFVQGFDIKTTNKTTGISERTVRSWYQNFRAIAEKEYRLDISKNLLGDGVVQIDESHFFGAKYNLGSALLRDDIWVFGEIDTKTMRVVAEVCRDRKAETLIPIIQSTIKPNSEIWSDLWKAYGSLNNLGFTHKTVNHSENFVDPNTKVNTQKIEGTWSLIKKFLKKNNYRDRNHLEMYIHKWCFRRKHIRKMLEVHYWRRHQRNRK